MPPHPVSPLATGGAGVVYEYLVAAMMLSRLLRGAHAPVGIDQPLTRVALQQRNAGYPLDDIVAFAGPDEDPVTLQIQVKRSLQVTGRNVELIAVVTAALEACRAHEVATASGSVADGSMQLGLAARAPAEELAELAGLTDRARAHARPDGLRALLRKGITASSLRARYDHVATAVATAAGVTDDAAVHALTHQILARLHVWQVRTDPDDHAWRAELDGLADVVAGTRWSPADLLSQLYNLAGQFGPHSGVLDAKLLRREVLRRFSVRLADSHTTATQTGLRPGVVHYGTGDVNVAHQMIFQNHRSS